MTNSAICSAITPAYLAQMRALAADLAEFAPGVPLYVLCIEDPAQPTAVSDTEPFHILRLADLGEAQAVRQMCFYYTAFELSCALRGLLHRYIRDHTDHEQWIFLDSDMMVVSPLAPVLEAVAQAPVTLTPHCRTPVFPIHRNVPELELLQGGAFNGGFVGIHREEQSSRFIDWLCSRLERYAFFEAPMFVDQAWLGLVPLFFPGTQTLNHPGVNIGHWNLHERQLAHDEAGRITSNGEPVVVVHFSGFDPQSPQKVSRWAPERVAPQPWHELADRYGRRLQEHGWKDCKDIPPPFSRFDDGKPIAPAMRRVYYDNLTAGRLKGDDPFEGVPSTRPAAMSLPAVRQRASMVRRILQTIWPFGEEVSRA